MKVRVVTYGYPGETAMGELVNLKRAKKRRQKDEADKLAEMNRAKFGRTKSEREREAALARQAASVLAQHKLPEGDAT